MEEIGWRGERETGIEPIRRCGWAGGRIRIEPGYGPGDDGVVGPAVEAGENGLSEISPGVSEREIGPNRAELAENPEPGGVPVVLER